MLDLSETNVSGSIPALLGQLRRLQTLYLDDTMLSGSIPQEIGNCSNLIDISLSLNSLSGFLPESLGALPRLQYLHLGGNLLSGPIPDSFGNLTMLLSLDLSENSISGVIPTSLGRLFALQKLYLYNNTISGTIPPELGNATSIVELSLCMNQISGFIPPEIGRLTKLDSMFMWSNQLEGLIPDSLASLSNLKILDLSINYLTGTIPPFLFHLPDLMRLQLDTNYLSGPLPRNISWDTKLFLLDLNGNNISGTIPPEVSRLKKIKLLALNTNSLTGSLPVELGMCLHLQMIDLGYNKLSGALPASLFGLNSLLFLSIAYNQFTGPVPDMFAQLKVLDGLMLNGNSLSGPIPVSLGQCNNLVNLDLSGNEFSGLIPDELCSANKLSIMLNLSFNKLSGPLPGRISALKELNTLDLSHNALSGPLNPLARMDSLVTLNVSNNNFSGHIPDTTLFRHLPKTCLIGNSGLCKNGWDACLIHNIYGSDQPVVKAHNMHIITIVLIVITMVSMVLGIVALLRFCLKGRHNGESKISVELASLPQIITFQNMTFSIEQVMGNLIESNKIGQGAAGEVYRVNIGTDQAIAVKKLWQDQWQPCQDETKNKGYRIHDSFWTEVRTIGSIRHRNIVRFLGYCHNSSLQILLYDFVQNGCLSGMLHNRINTELDWATRYSILLGVSHGLSYLHHDCTPPIIHRDIKTSNILIDLDFKPYLADFGIAKLFNPRALIHTRVGTFGYMAPEYTHAIEINEKSDVYSYGVVMLEVLTCKKPVISAQNGTHIVEWVQGHSDITDVLDPFLRCRPKSEVLEMLQVMSVALLCVRHIPGSRPSMKDVSGMLEEIRRQQSHEVFSSGQGGSNEVANDVQGESDEVIQIGHIV